MEFSGLRLLLLSFCVSSGCSLESLDYLKRGATAEAGVVNVTPSEATGPGADAAAVSEPPTENTSASTTGQGSTGAGDDLVEPALEGGVTSTATEPGPADASFPDGNPADTSLTEPSEAGTTTTVQPQSPDAALPNGAEGGASTPLDSGAAFDAVADLVAHFAFDETDGSVAINAVGSQNGTYWGECTHPPGRYGNAVGIRNREGDLDWIELPPGLFAGLSATTISVWLRDLSTARSGGRLFDFTLGSGERLYFVPDQERAEGSRGAHLGAVHLGELFADLWVEATLTDKAWHHVAVTWNDASLVLYINGAAVANQANPSALAAVLGATDANWLGRTLNDEAIALYAELDDLRIYSRALARIEVEQLHALP